MAKHLAHVSRRRWFVTAIPAVLVAAALAVAVDQQASGAAAPAPVSIYPAATVPVTPAEDDNDAVELGVRFTVSRSGYVTALKFYKSARNSGVHVGTLWSARGKVLARARFTHEKKSGWQRVTLSHPVRLRPHVTYVASYHTNRGYYAQQQRAFSGSGLGNKTIRATSGTFAYGGRTRFPTSTWRRSAYYVDVVFRPDAHSSSPKPPVTTPPSAPAAPSPTKTAPRTTPPPPSSSAPARPSTSASSPSSAPSAPSTRPASPPASSAAGAPAGAFPNASTTGVPAGTTLRKMGSVTISAANTVLQNVEVDGCVVLGPNANNVVIKNSLITSASCNWLVLNDKGARNLTIIDSELNGRGGTSGDAAIAGAHYTLKGVDIQGTVDGAKLGDDVVITDSYIHNLAVSGDSHNDGLQSLGSVGVTIRHNTIISPAGSTSAIILSTGQADEIRNVTIDDNLLAGGAYTVYGGYQQGTDDLSKVSGIRVTDNRFSAQVYPKGGFYGPLTSCDSPAVTVSGNAWYDGANKAQTVD